VPDLLLEIGAEEIPAGYIDPALAALKSGLTKALAERGFELPPDAVRVTGTPRRLLLWIHDLPERSPARSERVQGPPADRAFDPEGKPTKAAEGFARKCGVPVESLVRGKGKAKEFVLTSTGRTRDGKIEVAVDGATRETDKEREYVYAEVEHAGSSASAALKELLPGLVAGLPFPKSMRWIAGSRVAFARPVRSLLCLLDDKVVPFEFAGLVAGRESHGHPFHAPEAFALRTARYFEFMEVLRGRKVIADLEERRERVRACAEKAAEKSEGRLYNKNGAAEALVREVANLVEWPGAVIGSFDEQVCRELPPEVTVAAMTGHQRYFPIEDSEGRLLPVFCSIANRDPKGGGKAAVIRAGNERVLRARLADALFFWREDKKQRLADRLPALESVVFHEKLGSIRQKVERTSSLSRWLAIESGQEDGVADAAARSALLSKCDLVTKAVFEFPELQGVMGRYYAKEDGEPSSVRQAIEEHYMPRTAAMELPRSQVGRIVALADKFDSLVGGFAAGLAPTGSKDPYALRRAALGIIAIIRAAKLFRNGPGLRKILERSRELYRQQGMLLDAGDELLARITDFLRDRLEAALVDEAGGRVEVLRAVLGSGFDNLTEFDARLGAVAEMARRPGFAELCTVIERARNIVRKSPEAAGSGAEPQEALLAAPEEQELFRVYSAVAPQFRGKWAMGDYLSASELYVKGFAGPLHAFFEKVFVNVDDQAVRTNRLALVGAIYRLYAESIADLAECAGQAKA
jgi:glycyl-tRNA synthetase beta chain